MGVLVALERFEAMLNARHALANFASETATSIRRSASNLIADGVGKTLSGLNFGSDTSPKSLREEPDYSPSRRTGSESPSKRLVEDSLEHDDFDERFVDCQDEDANDCRRMLMGMNEDQENALV